MADNKIKTLLEGQELSEELMTQLQEAFDGEVQAQVDEKLEVKLAEQKVQMDEAFEEKVSELESLSESYIQDEVIPTLSKYATAAVTEWLEENKEPATASAKVELAESFMKGLVGLVESQQLTMSVEEYSALEEAKKEAERIQSELDEITEKNIELRSSLDGFNKERVVNRVCEDLTESQRDKIMGVAKELNFRDEDQFTQRVEGLIEDYGYRAKDDDTEVLPEGKEAPKDTTVVTEKSNSYESSLLKML